MCIRKALEKHTNLQMNKKIKGRSSATFPNVAFLGRHCETVKCYFIYGSSCPGVFCKKGVLGNFAKFIAKHLCQSLVFK